MFLTDEKLYELCRLYGERARIWRQKFLGLLPEVYKRELHKHKGFGSIHEFAAKLAGVSERQVDLVLNLEKKFCDKPDLHNALVTGAISVNKLSRVASIATKENQGVLLEQIKILPQRAVETFVRDNMHVHHAQHQNELIQVALNPELSDEVKQKLCVLQQKGIDINALILETLERRERDIEAEKQRLVREEAARARGARQRAAAGAQLTAAAQAEVSSKEAGITAPLSAAVRKISRHIPVKIERLVRQEYGSKCAVPNCGRDSVHIHHEIPFAMMRSHNPYFLKPLCEEHHVIAHNINFAYLRRRRSTNVTKCAFIDSEINSE